MYLFGTAVFKIFENGYTNKKYEQVYGILIKIYIRLC